MKRKIAAIMAANIAGYSRLVAEDEEETLRRLESYRAVFNDFIVRGSGRVFKTAGDAILAEFASSVEAVRCAIDVQESLRTRNLAYPPSRQMHFRIGITIGDVVERDGDLLGDGVNIAARLEGLAQPGGLCISSSVYEQVANKLSVQFADIGEQEVKNIPTPVHAYTLSIGGIHEQSDAAKIGKPKRVLGNQGELARRLIIVGSLALFVGGTLAVAWIVLQPRPSPRPAESSTTVVHVPSGAVSCNEEKNLRSLGTTNSTTILFMNKASETKWIYWLDFNGERKLYGKLQQGQSISIQTYITHPWVIANNSVLCQAIYMPIVTPQRTEIDG
jgi:adenylate cyclase